MVPWANLYFAATLEQRLQEQQQNGLLPNVQCVNLMEGVSFDNMLDLDQTVALSNLSTTSSESFPIQLHPCPDPCIPKSLEPPASIYISDPLSVDL